MKRRVVRDLVAEGVLRVEDGNHGNDRPRPDEFDPAGVPFIRAADMSSGVVRFETAGRINAVARARIRKGVGAPGDVILSHKGTVGRVATVPDDASDYVCSPQTTFWRSLDSKVLHQRYLAYVLRSPDFQDQLKVLGGQTDMAPYVSLTDQRGMRINVLGVSEQIAIADVLGALDDKIAANEVAIESADRLTTAVVAHSVIGTCALSDIALITMGSSPPGTSYNETGEGLPFYQGVRDFGRRTPTRRVFTTAPVRVAAQGDTLLSVRAPVGRVNVATESLCLGRGLAGIRTMVGTPWTLMHQVASASSSWEPYNSEGTVFGAINKQNLASAVVPAIPAHRLSEVEAEVAPLEEAIAGLTIESDVLARTRDSLLPLLMSGKVRVKDAERTVEGVL